MTALSIDDIHNQLVADEEVAENLLLSALARGDTKAVRIWQDTLAAAKTAREAVHAYKTVLAQ